MVRSTRALAAVERLKRRTGDSSYLMVFLPGDRFCLAQQGECDGVRKISEACDQDGFIALVDSISPPKPRKAGKLDIAFEKQLVKKSR
jgi:tagatose-1,6-bisphosphate aldolase